MTAMRNYYLILFITIVCISINFKPADSTNKISTKEIDNTIASIQWLSMEEAIILNKHNPKKVLVNISTNWCESCRKMDATTYSDPDVVNYIKEHFYAVKFDAESRKKLVLNGEPYQFNPNFGKMGVHNLALYLSNGRTVYPTTSILDEDLSNPQPVSGYLGANDLEMLLSFFGEDHYKSTEWSVFAKNYQKN